MRSTLARRVPTLPGNEALGGAASCERRAVVALRSQVCHVVLHRDCYLQCVRKYIDDLLLEHVEEMRMVRSRFID